MENYTVDILDMSYFNWNDLGVVHELVLLLVFRNRISSDNRDDHLLAVL